MNFHREQLQVEFDRLGQVSGDIISDIRNLTDQYYLLAKTEVHRLSWQYLQLGGLMIAAIVTSGVALVLLMTTLALVLNSYMEQAAWKGFAMVTVIAAFAAMITFCLLRIRVLTLNSDINISERDS